MYRINQIINSLTPTFLKKWDNWLLLNKPFIWKSKVHYIFPILLFAYIFISVLSLIPPLSPFKSNWIEFVVFLGVIFIAIVLIIWGLVLNNWFQKNDRNLYNFKQDMFVYILFVLASISIITFPFFLHNSMREKAKLSYNKTELVNDVNTIHLGNYLLNENFQLVQITNQANEECYQLINRASNQNLNDIYEIPLTRSILNENGHDISKFDRLKKSIEKQNGILSTKDIHKKLGLDHHYCYPKEHFQNIFENYKNVINLYSPNMLHFTANDLFELSKNYQNATPKQNKILDLKYEANYNLERAVSTAYFKTVSFSTTDAKENISRFFLITLFFSSILGLLLFTISQIGVKRLLFLGIFSFITFIICALFLDFIDVYIGDEIGGIFYLIGLSFILIYTYQGYIKKNNTILFQYATLILIFSIPFIFIISVAADILPNSITFLPYFNKVWFLLPSIVLTIGGFPITRKLLIGIKALPLK